MKIGRLFVGSAKTNMKDTTVVASWSYVTGYWRWCIYRSPWEKWSISLKPGMAMGTRFWAGKPFTGNFSANLAIPFVGAFNLSTQAALPAMKSWGTE